MARTNPVHLTHPVKGVDGRTTIAKARAPEATDGRVGDMFVDLVGKKLYGPKNAAGWPDNGLIKGDRGWAPIFAALNDGERRVLAVIDWIGGEGAKPMETGYVGAAGFVELAADALDIRGPAGPTDYFLLTNPPSISPRHINPSAGTGGDDTAAVQAAVNAAHASGAALDLDGTWRVTTISLGGGANPINVIGRAYIIGIASAATEAIIVFTGDKLVLSGSIKVDGQRSDHYNYGWWAKGSPNFQFVNLTNLFTDRCKVGFKIGDEAHPSALVSEIVVNGGGTYSCPVVGEIVGTETYVSLIGGMKSADANGGDDAWEEKTRRGLIVKGSRVIVMGGELIQAGSSSITDFVLDLQPLKKADGVTLDWPEVTVRATCIETGGPLALIQNPDGLVGTAGTKGFLDVEGCSGYHSQDTADFVQVASGAGFTGKIIDGGNEFRCPVQRTHWDINTNGAACDVYVSERGFGTNFRNGRAGVNGGTVYSSELARVSSYVPTVTGATGSFTSVSATGRYYGVGKMVHVSIGIAVTTNGSASGAVIVSLPFTSQSGVWAILSGRANGVSGKMLQAAISPGATQAYIRNYDGSYPAADGEALILSGWFECQ